jgi:two-component system cell cycle response regulator
LFFIAIVVVPLVVAGFLVRVAIAHEVDRRTDILLQGQAQAVGAAWQAEAQLAASQTRMAAEDIAGAFGQARSLPPSVLQAILATTRQLRGLDYLVVQQPGGRAVGSLGRPDLLQGAPPITTSTILAPGPLAPLLVPSIVPIERQGSLLARVWGGFFLDQDESHRLSALAGGVDIEVTVRGRPVASTLGHPLRLPRPQLLSFTPAKGLRALFTRLANAPGETGPGGIAVITSLQGDVAGLQYAILIVLFGSVVAASLLGFGLARAISEPIRRLADQASAVVAGSPELASDPELAIAERSGDEVTTVATTLSAMSEHLQQYASELSQSREELRKNLERLGTTLRSTHDLHGMLSVVLDSAALTLRAESGAVYLIDPADSHLFAEVSRGIEPAEFRMEMGEGIAGAAARDLRTVAWPASRGPQPALAEPVRPSAVAVPLVRGERAIGVVALYGRSDGSAFSAEDAATLAAFARETAVAVENVLLHEQAQRLSMTDALTGTGNRRFLEVTLAREVERARRYGRPVTLLMVDIDRFKRVNDEYGHLRGDEVLVGVAGKLEESVRHGIDIVARYGGEEFVVVLPETGEEGARVVAERIRESTGAELVDASTTSGHATGNGQTPPPDPVQVTVSIGYACFPDDEDSAQALVRAADLAMYAAKARGGNGVASARQALRRE